MTFCPCPFFNVYIIHFGVTNVRLAWHWSAEIRSFEKRNSFLVLFQTSWISNSNSSDWSEWGFDQRYSVNLIIRKVTKLKLKFLTLSLQYQHHASWCQQCSVDLALIDRDVIHWRKKLFFGALSRILDLEVLIRDVVLIWSWERWQS